ncbi:hypothetical protein SCHPADRAFT_349113 [Schizopora paradoxa]|uniref:Uncharacterized protein n=1 Tax=Schizopora paradoxa TaxID=27342 RepID=A0A0H2RW95_9AGAM|nr:hypothetical protein SCHPADRAFT_349113 [Schizopora paradoxa]
MTGVVARSCQPFELSFHIHAFVSDHQHHRQPSFPSSLSIVSSQIERRQRPAWRAQPTAGSFDGKHGRESFSDGCSSSSSLHCLDDASHQVLPPRCLDDLAKPSFTGFDNAPHSECRSDWSSPIQVHSVSSQTTGKASSSHVHVHACQRDNKLGCFSFVMNRFTIRPTRIGKEAKIALARINDLAQQHQNHRIGGPQMSLCTGNGFTPPRNRWKGHPSSFEQSGACLDDQLARIDPLLVISRLTLQNACILNLMPGMIISLWFPALLRSFLQSLYSLSLPPPVPPAQTKKSVGASVSDDRDRGSYSRNAVLWPVFPDLSRRRYARASLRQPTSTRSGLAFPCRPRVASSQICGEM